MPLNQKPGTALTLPYELVSDIFVLCLPLHRRLRPGRKRAPLHLAQICGYWRAIALALPELWRSMYLELPTGNLYDGVAMLFGIPDAEPVQDHTCALLDLWLSRAAGHSVSLTIVCPDRGEDMPENILNTIATHAAQYSRLELRMSHKAWLHLNKIAIGPFPLLRSLIVRSLDVDRWAPSPSLNLITQSPNLQALDSTWRYPSNTPSSLTSLQLGESRIIGLDEVTRIFHHFPRLLHFGAYLPYVQPPAPQPIMTPPLKSLLFRGSPSLFDVLTIPTLEHLELEVYHATPTYLIEFLVRSTCQVTHLALRTIAEDGAVYTSCFAALHHVPTLQLLLPLAAPAFIIYTLLQETTCLQHMHTLIVTDEANLPADAYTSFLAVLCARPALLHAELHIRPRHAHERVRVELPVLSAFQSLVRGGLSLRITTPRGAWPLPAWGDTDPDAVGNLDYDVFGSFPARPYFFSPF
ncbi:hypothetical protein DFH06DRAFT_1173284 [Mycena polygramma]|nr:hypothetical protein DFH06DRAFT_1173284 [Mycena polygramma]